MDRAAGVVWCYGAQSYRPCGTAAEYCVVPVNQTAPLPAGVPMEQGACLGIPGITAHRAVHVAGPVNGRTVLVQGAAGAVGVCAVQLARRAGARVIARERSAADEAAAERAGAQDVVRMDAEGTTRLRAIAPQGIDHIVEVAFDANIEVDADILARGGSIATYSAGTAAPAIPFWPLVFQNARVFFLGSDDFPREEKLAAARELNAALEAGWAGFEIAECLPLDEIVRAHEQVENPAWRGRILIAV